MLTKKKLVSMIVGGIVIVSIPTAVYGYNVYNSYNYNKYFNYGLTDFKNENFESAKNNFNSARKYNKKSDDIIEEKLKEVEVNFKSKQLYEDGVNQINSSKLVEAIAIFEKITKDSGKYYNMAQDKIIECKKTMFSKGINDAKAKAASGSYIDAITVLDALIDTYKENKEAVALKTEYSLIVKKQAEDAAAAKAMTAKAVETKKGDNSGQSSTANEYPKIIYLAHGVHIIENKQQDDGHLGGAFIENGHLAFGSQPFGIYFTLYANGEAYNQKVTYKAAFHFKNKDFIYNGVASGDIKFVDAPLDTESGSIVKVDFEVTYKGNVYKFSNQATYQR